MIKMTEKSDNIKPKKYKRKIKSPLMINADFEIILVPENNEKPNPDESYTNRY